MAPFHAEKPFLSPLFHRMSRKEIETALTFFEIVEFKKGDLILRETETGKDLYLLARGRVDIFKYSTDAAHQLSYLENGDVFGERGFFGEGTRSSSVLAHDDVLLYKLTKTQFDQLFDSHPHVGKQLSENIALMGMDKLSKMNDTALEVIKEKLEEASLRIKLGRFATFVISIASFYILSLSVLTHSVKNVDSSSYIDIPIICISMLILYLRSKFLKIPLAEYGITFKNGIRSLIESTLATLPILGFLTLCKWFLVTQFEAWHGLKVIDFTSTYNMPATAHNPMWILFLVALGYTIASPLQEILMRGFIQGSLTEFLPGKYRKLQANIVATGLFSIAHIQFSTLIAVLLIPFSLFWGYLFMRHKTIVGCSWSHILIGLWALFALDFERILNL